MTEGIFFGLGIAPGLLDVISSLRFTVPTPIQHKAIPIAIEGKDVIGVAQTGTGKTLAFGIPLIQRLAAAGRGKGLILVPTRELAMQVNETILKLAPIFKMRSVVLIGGESMRRQIDELRRRPSIIIATPGRLNDHLDNNLVSLEDVKILVLDEADRMLDMGFLPQIRRVLRTVPKERQTMLFSATMSPEVVQIASAYMRLPVRTEIAPSGTAAELVSQELFIVKRENKKPLLREILKKYPGSVLLFVRTRRAAEHVAKILREMNYTAAEIHSDRSMGQRKEALKGFKSGRYRILVATDIAARGIDVTGIELVINYDIPEDPENYVHRIGRTGRAGMEGHAISFATPDQFDDVRKIENILKAQIPISSHPSISEEKFLPTFKASKVKSFLPPGFRRSRIPRGWKR
ncbi:MAG TPA: DEAD/DEAH box helicase [Victivallales bacterium]|nr:DEAD/DEAH box helicase [Victivallales bacterium]